MAAGQDSDRLRNESSFSMLCGASPIPASSGKNNRHRLNYGGDCQATRALHLIAVCRLRYCERTRAYVKRRTAEGKTQREIMRCLKRYSAREVFDSLRADLADITQPRPRVATTIMCGGPRTATGVDVPGRDTRGSGEPSMLAAAPPHRQAPPELHAEAALARCSSKDSGVVTVGGRDTQDPHHQWASPPVLRSRTERRAARLDLGAVVSRVLPSAHSWLCSGD